MKEALNYSMSGRNDTLKYVLIIPPIALLTYAPGDREGYRGRA